MIAHPWQLPQWPLLLEHMQWTVREEHGEGQWTWIHRPTVLALNTKFQYLNFQVR